MDDSRDETIQILMEGNEPSKQQSEIVSIDGFGGLGKTSLANAVYEKLRACTTPLIMSSIYSFSRLTMWFNKETALAVVS